MNQLSGAEIGRDGSRPKMSGDRKPPVILTGLVRIREHCTFRWRRPATGGERTIDVLPTHCATCIAEALRSGYRTAPSGDDAKK